MNELRQMRNTFSKRYGKQTMKIVKRIAKGCTSPEIAGDLGIETMTVAATRANLTRGTYAPYAFTNEPKGFVLGTCNY